MVKRSTRPKAQKEEDKKIHIRLPEDIHRKLRLKCVYEDSSIQDYVERLIKESVAEYVVPSPPETRQGRK